MSQTKQKFASNQLCRSSSELVKGLPRSSEIQVPPLVWLYLIYSTYSFHHGARDGCHCHHGFPLIGKEKGVKSHKVHFLESILALLGLLVSLC